MTDQQQGSFESTYWSPEMRASLDKCIEKRRKFYIERTDESLKELREAENERHRIYYRECPSGEKARAAKWVKEQSKFTITCEVCNVQMKKLSFSKHVKSIKHKQNLELQGKQDDQRQTKVSCSCGLIIATKNIGVHMNSFNHFQNKLIKEIKKQTH